MQVRREIAGLAHQTELIGSAMSRYTNRTRSAVEDSLEGAQTPDLAMLLAIRVIATHVDEISSSIDRASNRVIAVLTASTTTIVTTAIFAALRLS